MHTAVLPIPHFCVQHTVLDNVTLSAVGYNCTGMLHCWDMCGGDSSSTSSNRHWCLFPPQKN